MTSHEEIARPPVYDSDKAALERAGKKEVLKVCLQQLRPYYFSTNSELLLTFNVAGMELLCHFDVQLCHLGHMVITLDLAESHLFLILLAGRPRAPSS